MFQIFFKTALALSPPGRDPHLGGEGSGPETEGCLLVLCEGGGRWSSRLMAELGQGAGLFTWSWQAGGHWGGSASAAVTRGKNNQGRTAASLSATKREIKLMSPPAKTCSPGPQASATNCSTSACQSNLNACDSPQRGLILTSSSTEKNIQTRVNGRKEQLLGGSGREWGPRLLSRLWLDWGFPPPNLVQKLPMWLIQPKLGEHLVGVPLKSGGGGNNAALLRSSSLMSSSPLLFPLSPPAPALGLCQALHEGPDLCSLPASCLCTPRLPPELPFLFLCPVDVHKF